MIEEVVTIQTEGGNLIDIVPNETMVWMATSKFYILYDQVLPLQDRVRVLSGDRVKAEDIPLLIKEGFIRLNPFLEDPSEKSTEGI